MSHPDIPTGTAADPAAEQKNRDRLDRLHRKHEALNIERQRNNIVLFAMQGLLARPESQVGRELVLNAYTMADLMWAEAQRRRETIEAAMQDGK